MQEKTITLVRAKALENVRELQLSKGSRRLSFDRMRQEISLHAGESLRVHQDWCSSPVYAFDKLEDGATYEIHTVLRNLIRTALLVFTLIGLYLTYKTKNPLFLLPTTLIIGYLILYLTIWKDRFLYLKQVGP
ncbi:MAG: hypothetical protein ACXIT9_11150 [Nitritalea sp.]